MEEQEWLDDFQRRVGEMRTKSLLLQGKLSRAEGVAQSGNGLVSVTVTPNGALKDLRIDDRALRQGGAQLTALIMETYGKAQRQVSREVADALEPLAGGTEMMQVVRSFLPPPEDEPAVPPAPEPPPPPVPPRPQAGPPQAAPPRPPRRRPDEGEDELQPW